MDLRTFVAESLVQIVQGVVDSAERISAMGGAVSPAFDGARSEAVLGKTPGAGKPVYLVDFDIAVTVSAGRSAESAERLTVAGVGSQQANTADSSDEQTASRLRFKVPVQLPMDPASQAAIEARNREQAEMLRRSSAALARR
jgi:hypothetical protein